MMPPPQPLPSGAVSASSAPAGAGFADQPAVATNTQPAPQPAVPSAGAVSFVPPLPQLIAGGACATAPLPTQLQPPLLVGGAFPTPMPQLPQPIVGGAPIPTQLQPPLLVGGAFPTPMPQLPQPIVGVAPMPTQLQPPPLGGGAAAAPMPPLPPPFVGAACASASVPSPPPAPSLVGGACIAAAPPRPAAAAGEPLLRQLDLRWFIYASDALLGDIAAAGASGSSDMTLLGLAGALASARSTALAVQASVAALLASAGVPRDERDVYASLMYTTGPPPGFTYASGWFAGLPLDRRRFEVVARTAATTIYNLSVLAGDAETRARAGAMLAAGVVLQKQLRDLLYVLDAARPSLAMPRPLLQQQPPCAVA